MLPCGQRGIDAVEKWSERRPWCWHCRANSTHALLFRQSGDPIEPVRCAQCPGPVVYELLEES